MLGMEEYARQPDSRGQAGESPLPDVQLRATQTLVSYMAFCWSHPSLIALEVAWRWLFGVPFLAVVWLQLQQILIAIPPGAAGLDKLNAQNPWVTSVLLADAVGIYQPAVVEVLRWLVPTGLILWAAVSGLGRTLVLWRMGSVEPDASGARGTSLLKRLPAMLALQGLWMAALLCCLWVWFEAVSWAAATHITSDAQPDLVGYLCWLIFVSLGMFVAWAVTSWTLTSAPILLLLEGCSLSAALSLSFRLGKMFSAKLLEVNLVLGIVKIALIVLAMVFCAAPLPFSDQFGPDFMNLLYVVITIVFLVANDYFHVVRIRSFLGLWRVYRGADPA